MSRPKGIIETKPRLLRSDRGKKRTHYNKKPCKHKKRKKFKRKIGNKKCLWLRAYWRIPMTRDGYKNFHPNLRPKIFKEITNMKRSPTFREVPLDMINTKEKLEKFLAENLWEDKKHGGKFVIMGGANAKTKTTFKPVAICTVIIKNTPDGNVCNIVSSKRLHKYSWFYKG